MRFISWNVNGLRAARGKGFDEIFLALSPDFFCLQETKLQQGQIDIGFDGYESYWCYAEKKGYSGTAIFTKHHPLSVSYNIGVEEHDHEGRAVTLEYEDFYLVCVYTPNAQDGLRRIDYRMAWEDAFRDYLLSLDAKKPVVVCGDMNSGFTDSFRYLYPEKRDAYSWWSYRAAARERNVGWRIDYFLVSDRLRDNIREAFILPEVMGSDHCPVGLDLQW